MCHEFCMNAFDHVFGKVLDKMQLTVNLRVVSWAKWVPPKRYSGFWSPLVRWNGLLSVCEKTNTELRWMAKTPSEFLDKLSTYLWPAICWICDTDFPKAKVSFGAAVELSKSTWLGGEWWCNVFTKYWCYVGNVEIQGNPTKSGECIAKSDIHRCKREVCNNGVVCFTDLKYGKRFVVFEKVIHFVPDQHVSVSSKCQVESLLIIFGHHELLRGDGFACKIQ